MAWAFWRGQGAKRPRVRKGGDETDSAVLRAQARRRLIGAAVLLLAVAIVVPLLLDPAPRPAADNIAVDIPSEKQPFTPRLAPPPVPGVPHWTVLNKIDLVREQERPRLEWQFNAMKNAHRISATTGAGLDALIDSVVRFAEQYFTLEPALVTRARQRNVLTEVVQSLVESQTLAEQGAGEELVAEQLRLAASGQEERGVFSGGIR